MNDPRTIRFIQIETLCCSGVVPDPDEMIEALRHHGMEATREEVMEAYRTLGYLKIKP